MKPAVPGVTGVMLELVRYGPDVLGAAPTLVLLFLAERTLAYRKAADTPSIDQMLHGVFMHDGRKIRGGCGLKKTQLTESTKLLYSLGLIDKVLRRHPKKGNLPTRYSIRVAKVSEYLANKSGSYGTPLVRQANKGSSEPLQTAAPETPLSARRTTPCPPGEQEQYSDSYSTEILAYEGSAAAAGFKHIAAAVSLPTVRQRQANCQTNQQVASGKQQQQPVSIDRKSASSEHRDLWRSTAAGD